MFFVELMELFVIQKNDYIYNLRLLHVLDIVIFNLHDFESRSWVWGFEFWNSALINVKYSRLLI